MEFEYYVATTVFEGIKLYFSKSGVWDEFSIASCIMAPSEKALDYHFYKWNRCHIEEDEGVKVEKLKMQVSFEEVN